ncbi:MAG: glycosyltransferase [Cyanobacteriota bacterium]|nr:glycosyltransferase [Cyanobacteriota bacterium]
MTFKVLQIIPSLSLARGGPTQVALNLTKALIGQGIVAEIATTNDNGWDTLDVPLNQRSDYQGLPVWFFPRFSSPISGIALGSDRGFIFSQMWTRWMWDNIPNYDILDNHYLFSYGSSCAAAIARRKRVPYTVRTMGQLSPWALAQSRRKKQLYSRLIERHNLQRAAAIHCTSGGEVEDVRNFGINTSTVTLPLGVNPPPILPDAGAKIRHLYNIESHVPIILFLSRLHYKKRPDLLLESLQPLLPQHPFHLIIGGAGETDYVEQLQQKAQDLGLQSHLTFAGLVAGTDKDLLLQGADVFVLPSHAENFGIAVAEAMTAGLPVIVTPGVQIAPDILEAEAGIVVKGEEEALGNAIAQLLTSPQQRAELGQNGKLWARSHYNWDAIASQLIPVYHRIIQGS